MSSKRFSSNKHYQGEVDKLVFSGEGLVRSSEGVVFVPFTCPGESVDFSITQEKKHYARAKIEKLHKPSKDRIAPLCSHYGLCGGCQLQHCSYELQLKAKKSFLLEALERQAKISLDSVEISPSDETYAYRQHIQLQILAAKQGCYAAYMGHGSPLLVESCPIFVKNASIFYLLQQALKSLKLPKLCRARVKLFKLEDETSFYLVFHFSKLPEGFSNWVEKLLEQKDFSLHIQALAPKFENSWHPRPLSVCYAKHDFHCSSLTFVQNHSFQAEKLYETFLSWFQEDSADSFGDFFCGIGVTLCLASSHYKKGFGVELSRTSCLFARKNLKEHSISHAKIYEGNLEQKQLLAKLPRCDVLLVNPPREGLSQACLDWISQHPPKQLYYVSCNPSTLARDLVTLGIHQTWKLEKIKAFDMFPQTTHLETLIKLSMI